MAIKVRAMIERLSVDTVRVNSLDHAYRLLDAVMSANRDRDVRVVILDDGMPVYTKEQRVSGPRACQSTRDYPH